MLVRAVLRHVLDRVGNGIFVPAGVQHFAQHVHDDAGLADEGQLSLAVVQKRGKRVDEVGQDIVAVERLDVFQHEKPAFVSRLFNAL